MQHNTEEAILSPLPNTWGADSYYSDDSIEIAPDDLFNQSNLAENIINVENKISVSSISTSYFSSQYFEHPALYRVLFMGSVTEERKKDLFKKLSQGFVHVLQQQHYHRSNGNITNSNSHSNYNSNNTNLNASFLSQPIMPFKETKHNVLLLNDDDEQELLSETYEDFGVSMIEADFTWNSNAVAYSQNPANLILQYAWYQSPDPTNTRAKWIQDNIRFEDEFKGFMFPEKTPNGIDLCVYFYDGQPQQEQRVVDDMELLSKLRKLEIYILPLTTTKDETVKTRFADLLTKYKVKCLEVGNLEVGNTPSFQRKSAQNNHYANRPLLSAQSIGFSTQLNLLEVAAYQILSIDQFCSIKNKEIFQLLKRTRDREARITRIMKEELRRATAESNINDSEEDSILSERHKRNIFYADGSGVTSSTSTNTSNSVSSSTSDISDHANSSDTVTHSISGGSTAEQGSKIRSTGNIKSIYQRIMWIALPLLTFVIVPYYYQSAQSQSHTKDIWTATFSMNQNFSFVLYTQDSTGKPSWSNHDPQVWLNNKQSIPLEKMTDMPGYYEIQLDVSKFMNNIESAVIPIMLLVNSSTSNDDVQVKKKPIVYKTKDSTSTSTTYLLVKHEAVARSIRKDTKRNGNKNIPSDDTTADKSNIGGSSSDSAFTDHTSDSRELNLIQRTWRTVKFLAINYSNMHKVFIKK